MGVPSSYSHRVRVTSGNSVANANPRNAGYQALPGRGASPSVKILKPGETDSTANLIETGSTFEPSTVSFTMYARCGTLYSSPRRSPRCELKVFMLSLVHTQLLADPVD